MEDLKTLSNQIVEDIKNRYDLSPEAVRILSDNMNMIIQVSIQTDFCTNKSYQWDMSKYKFMTKRVKL